MMGKKRVRRKGVIMPGRFRNALERWKVSHVLKSD